MRPIGKNVLAVCKALDSGHYMNYHQVSARIPGSRKDDVNKYLHRAVALGLVAISQDTKPHRFQVKQGWRDTVEACAHIGPVRRVTYKPIPFTNSVFQLGAQ